MTQAQLDCAVADATGESLRTVHRLGFSVLGGGPDVLESEDPALVLDCPFCGRAVPYPGRLRDGSVALAECPRCDLYFNCEESDVYAADPGPNPSFAGRAGAEESDRAPTSRRLF